MSLSLEVSGRAYPHDSEIAWLRDVALRRARHSVRSDYNKPEGRQRLDRGGDPSDHHHRPRQRQAAHDMAIRGDHDHYCHQRLSQDAIHHCAPVERLDVVEGCEVERRPTHRQERLWHKRLWPRAVSAPDPSSGRTLR